MLQRVMPVLEAAYDENDQLDPTAAQAALGAATDSAVSELRACLSRLNRFDAIRRLAFREIAHDPETYVESRHDGRLSNLLLVMSVAAEFDRPSEPGSDQTTPEAVEHLHTQAEAALEHALLRSAYRRGISPGAEAGRLALSREVYWGPPSWPDDNRAILGDLFSGTADRVLRSVAGFGPDELFAVVDAVSKATEYMSVLAIVEPSGLLLPRSGIYDLAKGVPSVVVDKVLEWFGTGLSQAPVEDPLEAVRARRLHPVLLHEDLLCWATPDLLNWAVQLSFEERLKGTKDFNPYQRHRADVVERRAVETFSRVLVPDRHLTNETYEGSHGSGEVDGLLIVDRVAVVLEAKAQMLTTRARAGDPTRLEHNLGDVLGAGSEQIGRFIRTLADDGRVALRESGETVERDEIDHVLGVIATLDELNSLAVATHELRELGVSVDRDARPTVLSLHGLTDTCRLLDRPGVLLHYLYRRRRTSEHLDLFAPEELDVVMYHLRQNLFLDDEPPGSYFMIGVETDPFDAWSFFDRGMRRRSARKPAQPIPVHVDRLLSGLETSRPMGWTAAAFHLLDLAFAARAPVSRMIKECRARVRRDGQAHDMTIQTLKPEPHGLSIVIGPADAQGMVERARFLANLNGLRYDADRWLGVAVEVSGSELNPIGVELVRPPFDNVSGSGSVPAPTWSSVRRGASWR